MLPNTAPAHHRLVYVPYWRFKGICFSGTAGGIKHRFLDISQQAIDTPFLPANVGLRSQALKLTFAAPEPNSVFLKPSLPLAEMKRLVEKQHDGKRSETIFHRAVVGDNISLIYSPFYMDGKIVDAVLNKPLSVNAPTDFDLSSFPSDSAKWPIQFVPALCRTCGWDLAGDRESLTLVCRNCTSIWLAGKKGLKPLPFGYIPGSHPGRVYLPFWRINTSISGMTLNTYADLVKCANLPKVITPDMAGIKFYFWIQAFKVRPKIFLRIARKLTLSQPREGLTAGLPDGRLYPVTLPAQEAVESLKLLLMDFVKPLDHFLENLPQIDVQPKGLTLAMIPFEEGQHEFIQPDLLITINKNMLAASSNL